MTTETANDSRVVLLTGDIDVVGNDCTLGWTMYLVLCISTDMRRTMYLVLRMSKRYCETQ